MFKRRIGDCGDKDSSAVVIVSFDSFVPTAWWTSVDFSSGWLITLSDDDEHTASPMGIKLSDDEEHTAAAKGF